MLYFMDGSKISAGGDLGDGVSVLKGYIRASYALVRYATVFQTEVHAILSVVRTKALVHCRERRVFKSSDSQAALKAI